MAQNPASETSIRGNGVIAALAARFPQLYVKPAEDALAAYRLAAGLGIAPEDANLEHFETSPEDELRETLTPAGPVEVVFLAQRNDFETFLRAIGHKAQPVPIAPTIGASTFCGVADWGKVAQAQKDYLAAGGSDWKAEFARLAKEPGAFRSEIIVISEGPYSNVPASETPYRDVPASETPYCDTPASEEPRRNLPASEEPSNDTQTSTTPKDDTDKAQQLKSHDWLHISREIRLYHECAHVVCRRLMPDCILPVWDEITADVTGLLFATGNYDAKLAARFLGVKEDGYAGGRLAEYLDETQLAQIDQIAREVYAALVRIETMCGDVEIADPFGFLLRLKESPLVQY